MSDGEHLIRERAHQLWEHAGRPEHRSHEFWTQAEAEMKRERAKPVAVSNKKASTKSAKIEATTKAAPPIETHAPVPAKPKAEAKAAAKPKPRK